MAQTTAAVATACAAVWVSNDGVTFTNISGATQSITGGAQSRITGEAYTFDGETAIVKAGKREPMESEVVIIYTETDAEVYQQVRARFEAAGCNSPLYLRYSPRGGVADDEQLTSGAGVLTSFTYPDVDASAGGPILGGFTVRHPGFTTTIIAS